MEGKTDSELVKLARQGNRDAFGVLAQRYQSVARRFALRLSGNEDAAQDQVQEAMLQAYLSLKNLRDPTKFKSWLYGILLNICRNHLRERQVAFFSLEAIIQGLHYYPAPLYETPPTPEQVAEEQERYQIVFDAVNALPAMDRDVILLFYYAQLSLQEIVNILNVPVTTIKVRLHRARRRLKVILQEKHPEIVPEEKRRKKMVKVTIADVIEVERKEAQLPITPYSTTPYVIVLYDEVGRRLIPIWIGPHEGQCIAMGLSDFAMPRPMTYNFFSSLLQSINARVEEVSVVALKKDTFYGMVKIRCGKKTSEVDARPSDAIALAVLNNVPIFVAEDVLESAGVIKIPEKVKGSPNRKGLEKIISGIRVWQRKDETERRQRVKQYHERSPEDIAKEAEAAIDVLFGK